MLDSRSLLVIFYVWINSNVIRGFVSFLVCLQGCNARTLSSPPEEAPCLLTITLPDSFLLLRLWRPLCSLPLWICLLEISHQRNRATCGHLRPASFILICRLICTEACVRAFFLFTAEQSSLASVHRWMAVWVVFASWVS